MVELKKYQLEILCIWILTSHHILQTVVMAIPVRTSLEYNSGDLKFLLTATDNRPTTSTFQLRNKDVKFYLSKIESSARTGLSNFKTGCLKNFVSTNLCVTIIF